MEKPENRYRHRAEKFVRQIDPAAQLEPPDDGVRLLHELKVYQIELEMQNDELRIAQAELEASRHRYVDLYDFAPIAYLTLDENSALVEINLACAELLCKPRSRLIGRKLTSFIHSTADQTTFQQHLEQAATRRERSVCEIKLGRTDPRDVRLHTVAMEDQGRRRFRVAIIDISVIRQAEIKLRFLSNASRLLANSLDYETTLRTVTRLAVPTVADLCAVHLLDASGALVEAGASHVSVAKEKLLAQLKHRGVGLGARTDVRYEVIRTGAPRLIEQVSDETFKGLTKRPEDLALLKKANFSSGIVVPLTVSGEVLGTLTLAISESSRRFNADDMEFAKDLAQHAALAIQNARLYRDAQRAVAASQRSLKLHHEAEERFRLLVDSVKDYAIITLDAQGRVASWNSGAERIHGYTAKEIMGQPIARFYEDSSVAEGAPLRDLEMAQRRNGHRTEGWRVRKDGSCYIADIVISPLFASSGVLRGFAMVMRDVTEHHANAERIRFLAEHDALTELPNRALFTERLHFAIHEADRNGNKVALMFLDLDRFKLINDTLGHHIGDLLLRAVADRLGRCIRACDTLARLGGDEFTVILTGIREAEQATHVARTIQAAFESSFQIGGHELFITPSIGITLYPADDVSAENLVKNADVAMYRAKEKGKNTFEFFTPEMNSRAYDRLALENALRHALGRGELELHYQPQIDISSSRIVGAEALLRWHHPALGMLGPTEFMPLMEETGLIVPIGRWVMDTACSQARAWHQIGWPLTIAVNLSSRQFPRDDLVDTVTRALEKTGLEGNMLELELTETQLMQNTPLSIATMEQLNDLGVAFSIDDFGTGYSSLSYLKRFPIDALKIDRSFIRDLTTDADDAGIAAAIIVMAQTLGLKVVAEGVETIEQLAFLRERHCDAVQGFYFGEPLAPAAFDDLLRRHASLN